MKFVKNCRNIRIIDECTPKYSINIFINPLIIYMHNLYYIYKKIVRYNALFYIKQN